MKKSAVGLLVVIFLWIHVLLSLAITFKADTRFVLGIAALLAVSVMMMVEKFKKWSFTALMCIVLLSVWNLVYFSYCGIIVSVLPHLLPVNIISTLLLILLLVTWKTQDNNPIRK
jgi:hypothetical protein